MLDYLYFAFLMLVGQLSPGPDMLLILKNSFNHNLRAALFTIAGIIAGITIHTTVALTGLTVLFREGGLAYEILRYGGAIYLTYLGVRLLLSLRKSSNSQQLETGAGQRAKLSDRAAFTQGFLTNILNPKVIIIISTILLMFIDAEAPLAQRLTYGAILIIEGLVVWVIFALALQTQTAKKHFMRWQNPINCLFGLLLIALAIRAVI